MFWAYTRRQNLLSRLCKLKYGHRITWSDYAKSELDQHYSEVQIKRGIQLFSQHYLYYYSNNPYVVGTQKNRLTETILLSTHNIGFNGQNISLGHAKRCVSSAIVESGIYNFHRVVLSFISTREYNIALRLILTSMSI